MGLALAACYSGIHQPYSTLSSGLRLLFPLAAKTGLPAEAAFEFEGDRT